MTQRELETREALLTALQQLAQRRQQQCGAISTQRASGGRVQDASATLPPQFSPSSVHKEAQVHSTGRQTTNPPTRSIASCSRDELHTSAAQPNSHIAGSPRRTASVRDSTTNTPRATTQALPSGSVGHRSTTDHSTLDSPQVPQGQGRSGSRERASPLHLPYDPAVAENQFSQIRAWRMLRHLCATHIQAHVRGFLTRQRICQALKLVQAQDVLQRSFLRRAARAWKAVAVQRGRWRCRVQRRFDKHGVAIHMHLGRGFNKYHIIPMEGKLVFADAYRHWRTQALVLMHWQLLASGGGGISPAGVHD